MEVRSRHVGAGAGFLIQDNYFKQSVCQYSEIFVDYNTPLFAVRKARKVKRVCDAVVCVIGEIIDH